MAWTEPPSERAAVNKAAQLITRVWTLPTTNWEFDLFEVQASSNLVNRWRAAHSYPLNTLQTNLRRAARRFEQTPLIAQRTKRLVSIVDKLRIRETMKLTQMQDIGGCRAVMEDVAKVRQLDGFYRSASAMKHQLASRDDYITDPKNTGYRGIHLVYRYYSDKTAGAKWNGLKVEMQLRSQFQHAWATAVETVGTFLGQALKSSSGPDEWLRFFALMGSVIALRERTPPVPGTPGDRSALIDELRHHAGALNVEARLAAFSGTLQRLEHETGNANLYLMQLDTSLAQLSITGFRFGEFEKAQAVYSEAEQRASSETGNADVVLVSVDSLSALQRAYPNYFADTRVFVTLLKQALSGDQRRIAT